MQGFITDVLLDLQKKGEDFSHLTFVLPSRRAGVFLKRELSKITPKSIFAPTIFSIEEFVQELSELRQVTNIELLFEFYSVYIKIEKPHRIETFDTFSKWATILLQDFNEIDRFLVEPHQIFDYLSAVKKLESWNLETGNPSTERYLSLWENINSFYQKLRSDLLVKNQGYQGLIYREAVNNLESYLQNHTKNKYVFLGFNALNNAETVIIQEFLGSGVAEIYWDTDQHFDEDVYHNASMFIRRYKEWTHFRSNKFNWISNNYSSDKQITAIATAKNIGQAKCIGNILDKTDSYDNTAVILADENLLNPVLNVLPSKLQHINITMGFPLNNTPIASLFDKLILMHHNHEERFYFKDVINILSHQGVRQILNNETEVIIEKIKKNNYILLTKDEIKSLTSSNQPGIDVLFKSWNNSPNLAIESCINLIYSLKKAYSINKEANLLNLEYLYRFYELFITLKKLNESYKYISSLKILHGLFKELLSFETLDFQGEPLKGLQLMGMLESRVLDFETVIISSVNEGILPSGKTDNSFIPFDLKIQYGLPTYKEKDAIYCYHFYRLIQRAQNVYLIYNTEPDVLLGGEKSRFITQMEVEGIHSIKNENYAPNYHPILVNRSTISKTSDVMIRLLEVAKNGLSPSSLSTYIRNPIDFYSQKVLGIKEYDEVEETVAANTLGTVVHNSLDDLYTPLEGRTIAVTDLQSLLKKIEDKVKKHFKKEYKKGNIDKGKNLIIFEIAKRYVSNFIKSEIDLLKRGHQIKILHTERDLNIPLLIPELNTAINLVGKIDRVDMLDGVLRIIDYKSGKVERSQLEVVDWEDITTDYKKYSKSFQVLTYAYMLNQETPFKGNVEAGIISFKNQKSGFLKFAKKDRHGVAAKKESCISTDILDSYYKELKTLIIEILDPNTPFKEKEIQ